MEQIKTMNDGIRRRLIEAPVLRSVSEDERMVEFVASDNSVDSYRTILPVDKWDLSRYEKNGAVGYMHDVYGDSWSIKADPDDIIGKGVAFVEDDQLIVRIYFEPKDLNERADKIYRKLQFGSLNAVSVGFQPTAAGHWGEEQRGEDPEVYYYDGQELLEVSIVNIPANKNAVKRSFGQAEEEQLRSEKPQPQPEPQPEPLEEERSIDADFELTIAKARRALV